MNKQINNFLYSTEKSLVEDFCEILEFYENPWGSIQFMTEFNYQRGKTDIVAINKEKEIIAFEVKLEKWRVALHQAYKNTSFAHFSYVVLPDAVAHRAKCYPYEFLKRSVGLCTFDGRKIKIIFSAMPQKPIQPWLRYIAESKVMERYNNGAKSRSIFNR